MTSREVIDLLNLKDGRDGTDRELTYTDLCKAMNALGIVFKAAVYRGFTLTCYLNGSDIHAIAGAFGIDLYPRRPSSI